MRRWVLAGSILLLTGCGTTHHYLPALPLPPSTTEISVTWSYTLGRNAAFSLLPTYNVYWGTGNNWNLGAGFQAGYLIPHITAAKYWEQSEDGFLTAFVHANQLMSVTENPYLELGIGRSKLDEDFRSHIMAGLAYGHGNTSKYGLVGFKPDLLGVAEKRIIPFVKGQARAENVGFSYAWYLGKSSAALAGLAESVDQVNPTIATYGANEIDSVRDDLQRDRGSRQEVVRLFLKNGSVDEYWGPKVYICGMGSGTLIFFGLVPHPILYSKRQHLGTVTRWLYNHRDSQGYGGEQFAVYSNKSEFLELDLSKAVIIRRYGSAATNYFTKNFNIAADHSLGLSIYPIMPE